MRPKTNIYPIVISICLVILLLSSRICFAEIDNFAYAHHKLIADVFAGEKTTKEVFGNPNLVTGDVTVQTTTGSVGLGSGPGWVFFIRDSSNLIPMNKLVMVTTSGKVTRKHIKGEPISFADFLRLAHPQNDLRTYTESITTIDDAYNRLINGLLGHTVGNRRIYVWPEKLEGQVTAENWSRAFVVGRGPGWLFFIDDNPAANWEHSCRFVLVTESGEILVTKSMTPPKEMAPFEELTAPQPPTSKNTADEELNNSRSRKEHAPKVGNLLGEPNTPAANRWAVIISGGYNQSNNHIRYWNDSSYFYTTLMAHGFLDDHVYVLISDGTNPAADRSDGTNSPADLDGDGDDDTQYSATKANITTVFNDLQGLLGVNDILYVFTTDHGGSDDTAPYDDPTVKLYLWGETITDDEFATEVNKVTTKATVCIFEQCFSGGMIDDLEASNRVLMSASRFWELSYAMGPSYHYDEFSYYLTYALANPSIADANSDGQVSMEEGYLYALAHDSYQSETLDSSGDNEGEHPSYYSNPWDLGRKISLSGYDDTVTSPVLGGYSQRQIVESFPSGGVDQGWSGDDTYWTYTLPFNFPYNGTNYSQIYISSNGIIYFENPSNDWSNSVDELKSSNAVAPLWDDLLVDSSSGDAIYITEDTYWVTIRWQAHTCRDARPVNVAAKLSSSGAIRFLYGSGNDHTSRISRRDKTIGISNGDDSNYHLCLRNGRPDLGNAQAIEYSPSVSSTKKVLYFSDLDLGDNPFPTALTQLGLNYIHTADFADFEARVNSGGYALVIALLQQYAPGLTRPSSLPNFASYLSGGGKAIFVDWYRQPTLAPYFGITFVGGPGFSDYTGCNDTSVTLTAPFLTSKVGNTLTLMNPGWYYFSVAMNLNSAKEAARYTNNGYVAIAYTPKTIINGPLKDTFQDFNKGIALAKAEISYLMKAGSLPAMLYLLLGQ